MPILGAHQSIAGGFYRAVERASAVGGQCVQLFTSNPRQFPIQFRSGKFLTKNNNQWRAKPITPDEADAFRAALKRLGVAHPIAHDSYLINLGSSDRLLWQKSVDAFVEELLRAELLGIPYVVTHPGAGGDAGDEVGLNNIVRALDEVHRQTRGLSARCLLETTAGQGSAIGWKFEHLAAILEAVRESDRLGVCFDTCHVFAAGYDFGTKKSYDETMADFDRLIGLDRIKAFHLNDSLRERGSRVDRHAHIGRGKLGSAAFQLLLNDARFEKVPMYLETPKGEENGEDLDVINLRTLRGLEGKKKRARR